MYEPYHRPTRAQRTAAGAGQADAISGKFQLSFGTWRRAWPYAFGINSTPIEGIEGRRMTGLKLQGVSPRLARLALMGSAAARPKRGFVPKVTGAPGAGMLICTLPKSVSEATYRGVDWPAFAPDLGRTLNRAAPELSLSPYGAPAPRHYTHFA